MSVNDQMAFNSQAHTRAFLQYRNILVWTEYKSQHEGDQYYHSCGITRKVLTQDDLANIYFMTRFMRDEELNDINLERIRGCGCGKCSLEPLPRLAYAGSGVYKAVRSQKERVFVEAQISGVKIEMNIDEVEQQHHINPVSIETIIEDVIPDPNEGNIDWDNLGRDDA